MTYATKLAIPESEVVDRANEAYGLDAKLVSIRRGLFSTIVFLSSGDRKLVLKCYRTDETDPGQLTYAAQLNRYLAAKGIPVAAWRATRGGEGILEHRENFFQLWEQVEGTPFKPSVPGLEAAAGTLGRFHNATESYPGIRRGNGGSYWGGVQARMEETWRNVLTGNGPAHLVETFREHLTRLEPYRRDLEAQPSCVIHSDYRAQNMVFRDHTIAAVLDLDSVRKAPRIYDLSYAVIFFQAVLEPGPLNPTEMSHFFRAYHAELGLSDQEKRLMPKALGFCLLQGLSLWLEVAFVSKVNPDSVITWIDLYLPLLTWLDRNGELVF
ncbi:MAG: hypothetical protein CME25_00280 [Gemmatimonadetes bacterium]|nr:hypothetical protein [Gemmatimonadota bacterium]